MCVTDREFRSDRIVSELMPNINYKTRYEVDKAEHTCILCLMLGNELEDPKNEGF